MDLLELRGVSKTYGQGAAEVHALRGVDLTVDAGTMVAVMGPSGSGKSNPLTYTADGAGPTTTRIPASQPGQADTESASAEPNRK
jgi:putative ABC transport system ATP-binding protein